MKNFIKTLGGMDKIAHFGIGAVICACFTIACMLQDLSAAPSWHDLLWCAIGTIVTAAAAAAKEVIIDENGELSDFIASMLGCTPIWLAVAVGIALNHLSQ